MATPARRLASDTHRLSNRQQEQRLRDSFINPRRVREWRDTHAQLHTVVAEQGWRLNGSPATYEQLHLSMLAGLLGNVGCKSDDEDSYLGARGIQLLASPGRASQPQAGTLARRRRARRDHAPVRARRWPAVEPQWITAAGGHTC
jgi:ATP-dependent helicase HrpA